MSEMWPPNEYSEPKQFTDHLGRIFLTGAILLLPTWFLVDGPISTASSSMAEILMDLLRGYGFENLVVVLLAAFLVLIGWILVSSAAVIAVHESIHFLTTSLLGRNPSFRWSKMYGLPNPSVAAFSTGIRRWELIVFLISPFVLISVICGAVMFLGSGVVSGTAGVMFAVNAVPSCSDVYKTLRIVGLERGALFANFDDGGELRSEYVVPRKEI